MTVVAVGAHCRTCIATGHGLRVNALSIRQEWTLADAASLHHGFVPVALAAGLGNGRSVDCRTGMVGGQDRRQVAILCVAIKTRRRFRAIVNRLGVETVIVASVRSGVEERACQIRRCLPRGVASLTLKCRRRGRNTSISSADNTSFVRFYHGSRRILIGVLIILSRDRLERMHAQ